MMDYNSSLYTGKQVIYNVCLTISIYVFLCFGVVQFMTTLKHLVFELERLILKRVFLFFMRYFLFWVLIEWVSLSFSFSFLLSSHEQTNGNCTKKCRQAAHHSQFHSFGVEEGTRAAILIGCIKFTFRLFIFIALG